MMFDRENVLSNLELNIRWICDYPQHQFPGWANVEMAMRDAVELLNEQQQILDIQHEAMRGSADISKYLFTMLRNVVSCADCRYFQDGRCYNKKSPCKGRLTRPKFYCADGVNVKEKAAQS